MKRLFIWSPLVLCYVISCNSQTTISIEESLSDQTDFLSDPDESESLPSLFKASKDAFLKASAFNFGQAWFKIRGYDSRYGKVTINGLEMNKWHDHRPQWSNWGGLNDIFKPFQFSFGLEPANHTFGDILGSTNFEVRASSFRPMKKLSLASSNRSYATRLMSTYTSGITPKGIAYALSFSRRKGKEGYIDGTFYRALSGLVAVEKIINQKHSINGMVMGAFNQRNKSSPNTREVSQIRGIFYNANWGYQEGKKRGSNIKSLFEPVLMLSHFYQGHKTEIKTTIGIQKGSISNSRIGYFNAKNPSPTYYQNLPSYFLRDQNSPDYENAYKANQWLISDGQIAWNELYGVNSKDASAYYYFYEDKNDDTSLFFSSNVFVRLKDNMSVNGNITINSLVSENYAEMLDLLGSKSFVDLNPFAIGEARQNNLNDPNRAVSSGQNFLYHYDVRGTRLSGFIQLQGSKKKWDYFLSFRMDLSTLQREGYFKNGSYPGNSFGKSEKLTYADPSIKGGITYKFSGRHLLSVNTGFLSKSPSIRNLFTNIRVSNNATPDLASEKIILADINYTIRLPNLLGRFTTFRTLFNNGSNSRFFFAQGLMGDQADFINETVTGISRSHFGFEWSVDYQFLPTLKLLIAGTYGKYTYTNNPNVLVESDTNNGTLRDFGPTYIKGMHVPGSHQKAYSIGFEYNDPNYWWFQLNGNFMVDNYLSMSSLLRTKNFFIDGDGIPFISEETGKQISSDEINTLLNQEKLDDFFLLNIVGGKSWKMNNTYLSLFLGINNVLGEVFRTGGFEQSRYVNYPEYKKDKNRDLPLFGSKYWYGNPTTYFINLSVKL